MPKKQRNLPWKLCLVRFMMSGHQELRGSMKKQWITSANTRMNIQWEVTKCEKKEILDIAYITHDRNMVRCLEEISCLSQILPEIPKRYPQK